MAEDDIPEQLELADGDESPDRVLLAALLDVFTKHLEEHDYDFVATQESVIGFGVTATHVLMYDAASRARENHFEVERAAGEWLESVSAMFNAALVKQSMIQNAGHAIGEPEVKPRFNRKFRRRV